MKRYPCPWVVVYLTPAEKIMLHEALWPLVDGRDPEKAAQAERLQEKLQLAGQRQAAKEEHNRRRRR